jgi:hypothetical protein
MITEDSREPGCRIRHDHGTPGCVAFAAHEAQSEVGFIESAMSVWPAAERTETPRTPRGERTSLETWLEYHRATLLMKCAGLDPEQLATRSCPPSSLSLLGLVRHVTEVETLFHDFDGQPHGQYLCLTSPASRHEPPLVSWSVAVWRW